MTTEEDIYIQQLMIERLAGTIKEQEDAYLYQIIESDDSYKEKYELFRTIFDQQGLSYLQETNQIDEAWGKVHHRIAAKSRNRKRVWKNSLTAAAIIIPLVIIGWLFKFKHTNNKQFASNESVYLLLHNGKELVLNNQSAKDSEQVGGNIKLNITEGKLSYSSENKQHAAEGMNTLIVPIKQTYEITLSDGTEVWLNSLSSLKFPFSFNGKNREVYLKGEAYFKVVKDTKHPFLVHTALTTIKDLGTEFNVNSYNPTSINTSLVEGSVITFGNDGSFKELVPGKEAVFTLNKGFTVNSFDKDSLLSWRNGVYYFNHTPLDKIEPLIYRWFGKEVVLDNAEISKSLFTGALFRHKPLKEFLDNLSFTSNLRYKDVNDKIYITTQ